jgi:hypothetical protein
MKARIKTTGFLFAVLLSLWAFVQAGSGQTQQTGLKSDEETIRAFVEKYGFYETSGPNGEYNSERERAVFEGCRLTAHVEAVGADEPPYKRETIKFDVVIDLKKMDPKTVAAPKDLNGNMLPDGREWIILKTVDGQEWIAMEREGKLMSASSAWLFPGGTNHEENQKVADAFGRVVAACGQGK